MPDFTLKTYKNLLQTLKGAGYRFITFEEYLRGPADGSAKTQVDDPSPITHHPSPTIILRHDVDLLPRNSLAFAHIQHEMGIRGSYYFRAVPESWDEKIIKKIYGLGHEVGYHYEDIDKVNSEKSKVKSNDFPASEGTGNVRVNHPSHSDLAIKSFQRNLEQLRQLVPVSTICMHGSPRSRFDNRDLWKEYDYRDYGIIGEPYFDVNFDEMFYLTDTGRRWDGWQVSIRDKMPQQQEWIKQGLVFRSTQEIIERLKNENLKIEHQDLPASAGSGNVRTNFPVHLMMTFHPQRWTDKPFPWVREWVMQNAKNGVKYFINLQRGNQ